MMLVRRTLCEAVGGYREFCTADQNAAWLAVGRETFLDFMNALLAIATVVFLIIIIVSVWKGVIEYRRFMLLRKKSLISLLKRLGITLPDGGSPVEDEREEKTQHEEESNREEDV